MKNTDTQNHCLGVAKHCGDLVAAQRKKTQTPSKNGHTEPLGSSWNRTSDPFSEWCPTSKTQCMLVIFGISIVYRILHTDYRIFNMRMWSFCIHTVTCGELHQKGFCSMHRPKHIKGYKKCNKIWVYWKESHTELPSPPSEWSTGRHQMINRKTHK